MNNIYILTDKKVEGAINLPLLEINPIASNISKIDFDRYDGLIITSKNAVFSLENSTTNWKQIPSYAIAPMTADIIKGSGGYLAYTGKYKHGNEFAKELTPILKDKRVLYLRGSKVVSNLVQTLNSHNIICDEAIVYESSCKKEVQIKSLPQNSTIIFSSPSTIECFLDKFKWDSSYKAISIGKTTAQYFPKYIKPIISDDTSLEACVLKANEIVIFEKNS